MSPPSEARPVRGTIEVPGDKSVSHRALILSGLASGRSRITSINPGADVRATAECLRRLGVSVPWPQENSELIVESSGFPGLQEASDVLDAGNSGTTLRLLAGVCSAVPGTHVLTGDPSWRARPMARIVEPLRAMGARIEGRDRGRLPPLVVHGASLQGIDHRARVASAQVKSALLLAGLRAVGTTAVSEPSRSRDHTERMMAAAGVRLEVEGNSVRLEGGQSVEPTTWHVPGDLSSAMYIVVAACLIPGSEVRLINVGLNPTRTGGLEVLKDMGGQLSWDIEGEASGEPVGTIVARHSELRGTSVSGDIIPRTIDEIPILAVAATQAVGTTSFADVGELRVKESDRLDGLARMLSGLGARAEASDDALHVTGPTPLRGGTVDARGDHRMALASAVAATVCRGEVQIDGWSSVETSFPGFAELFAAARGSK